MISQVARFRTMRSSGMRRVGLVQRFHTAEFLDVLGRFLFRDVEHVVDRDDADEHSAGIDHRQRGAIVFAENVDRFLLRIGDVERDEIFDPSNRSLSSSSGLRRNSRIRMSSINFPRSSTT